MATGMHALAGVLREEDLREACVGTLQRLKDVCSSLKLVVRRRRLPNPSQESNGPTVM